MEEGQFMYENNNKKRALARNISWNNLSSEQKKNRDSVLECLKAGLDIEELSKKWKNDVDAMEIVLSQGIKPYLDFYDGEGRKLLSNKDFVLKHFSM